MKIKTIKITRYAIVDATGRIKKTFATRQAAKAYLAGWLKAARFYSKTDA